MKEMLNKPNSSTKVVLTQAQKKIIEKKYIRGEYRPNKLLKTLKNISIYDERQESITVLWLSAIWALVFVMILFLMVEELRIFSPLAVVGIIFCCAKRSKVKQLDINDHIRYFLLPFFALIKDDVKLNSKIDIYADALSSTSPKYKVPESSADANSRGSCCQYLHPWLKGSFLLADGIELAFESQKLITKKTITKRSASGKSKTKIKIKSVETIILSMMVPKSKYVINNVAPGVQLKEKSDYFLLKNRFRYKYKLSWDENKMAPYLPVDSVIQTIGTMYQSLKAVN